MKNMIVVADWFIEDHSQKFLEFITTHQSKIESIYFNGEFYSVENTLKNFAS